MAEALSRSEVESLLSALNPAQTSSSRIAPAHLPALGQHTNTSELARRVVGLFERFRHAMASATREMLPEPARLKRHMPVRVPFSELKSRVEQNQLLLLVESEQSGGDLLAILDRRFAIRFVSCLLGQGAQAEEFPDQPPRETLSPLEQRLLLRWMKESLTGVVDAAVWEPVEIEPVHSGDELDPYHAQAPWWCEIWELKTESLRGRIELCGGWEFFASISFDEVVEDDSEKNGSFREPAQAPQNSEILADSAEDGASSHA